MALARAVDGRAKAAGRRRGSFCVEEMGSWGGSEMARKRRDLWIHDFEMKEGREGLKWKRWVKQKEWKLR